MHGFSFWRTFQGFSKSHHPQEERERKAQERAEAERKREEEHCAARECILSLALVPDRKDMKN